MALVSLICTAAVGVLWLRAPGGHADPFSIPWVGVTYQFSSVPPNSFDPSRLAVRAVRKGDLGWYTETHYLKFKEVMGYTLIIPAIWVAIWVRSKIPRPTRPPRDRLATRLPKL